MTGTRLVTKLARMMVCGMRGLHSSQFEWYRDNDFITASEFFWGGFLLSYLPVQIPNPIHTSFKEWQMSLKKY